MNWLRPRLDVPITRSGRDGSSRPGVVSRGSKLSKGRSADEVGLKIEGVIDRSVGGKEALGGALTLKLLLLPFPSSDDEMRVFGPVVFPHAGRSMAIG